MKNTTFLQMSFNGGRGKIAVNLPAFLPCSAGDFKKVLDIIADSDNPDGHAETLCNYIVDAVQDLKSRRDRYGEETEAGRKERQALNAKLKKFVALSEKLADRFQTVAISTEDETASIRMKSATVYALHRSAGEPPHVEVFNGWIFEKGGRGFEIYKCDAGRYAILLAGTGTMCATAKSRSAAPYEITKKLMQALDINAKNIDYYRKEYEKAMIAAGYIEEEAKKIEKEKPEKAKKEDAAKEAREEETDTRMSAPKKEGKKMAMTNEQIIFNKRIELAQDGVIRYTGRKLRCGYIDDNGEQSIVEIDEPEEIHTFARWKEMGYIVKKGEHARAAFVIWKAAKGKREEDDDTQPGEIMLERPRMFHKKAFFFTADQVQPIDAAPEGEKLLPVVWSGLMLPAVA